ncbi:hypothetical protein PMI34_01895 [Pseudomonas sp. GM74]|nr:hypothetical protein PMI34_01895 [Pseudomonas sp. GM74]
MSWLFSQALVAEYSEATSWAGAPSAPLSVMPTPHKFWRNDKPMAHSRLSQFGLTYAVLTEDDGEALLTWFLADSHAKTSLRPETAPALTDHVLDSGEKWHELSAKYDLHSSTWKTHLCLWEEDLPWSSVNLPKWGMTRSGALFQHPTLERPTSGTELGSWPMPTRSYGAVADGDQERSTAVTRTWPTPVASMAKGSSKAALTRKSGADRSNDRLDHAVMASDGGQLNPEWVEWLMGWPIGWTELKPLEMDRFHEWQQQHSFNYQRKMTEAAE